MTNKDAEEAEAIFQRIERELPAEETRVDRPLARSQPTRHCQFCRHWSPLFTGEEWGVRSFVDAPVEVQAEIKASLAKKNKRKSPHFEIGLGSYASDTDAEHKIPQANADNLPWLEWGECERTKLEGASAENSLALAMDGSVYMAILRCHATFSCVQWEQFSE